VALKSAVVWKIVPSYRSFEDRERTVVELKYFFFNTLYFCTIAFVFPNLLSFHDYSFFFFFSFYLDVSLVYFLCT
jgi:hypothetical protein